MLDHNKVYQFTWDDQPTQELVDFVLNTYPIQIIHAPQGAQTITGKPPEMFKQYVEDRYKEMGLTIARWKYWTTILRSTSKLNQTDTRWIDGFPHFHGHGEAISMLQYLQVSDSGGALVCFLEDGTEIKVQPEVGKTLIFSSRLEHGVERVYGDINRIALIVVGWPDTSEL